MKNATISRNRALRSRLSQKGKKKTVGAPRKNVKYPRTLSWGFIDAWNNNPTVSDLTIRNRMKKDLELGLISLNGTRPQPKGKVGRPEQLYVLTALKKTEVKTSVVTPTPAQTVEATA